jgi:hypothetical protein
MQEPEGFTTIGYYDVAISVIILLTREEAWYWEDGATILLSKKQRTSAMPN